MEEHVDIPAHIENLDGFFMKVRDFSVLREDWKHTRDTILQAIETIDEPHHRLIQVSTAMDTLFDFWFKVEYVARKKSLTPGSFTNELPPQEKIKIFAVGTVMLYLNGIHLGLRQICTSIIGDMGINTSDT